MILDSYFLRKKNLISITTPKTIDAGDASSFSSNNNDNITIYNMTCSFSSPNQPQLQSYSLYLVSDNKMKPFSFTIYIFYFALLVKQLVTISSQGVMILCLISTNIIPRTASYHCCLSSSHSFSAAIFPELRPPIFPNEFTLDNPLMLLLPPSFMVRVFLDLLGLEKVMSTPS